ncbi:MAG: CBS domain-containing protein [Nitrospirae bacterium]|nr:CBS domain-containing protein [Nitrospirota bacterium]
MNKTVADIMTKKVITVSPEDSLRKLAEVLTAEKISGAPVVDSTGRYLGVVGEHDLIRHEKPLHIPTVLTLFDSWIPLELPSTLKKEIARIGATSVKDILHKTAPTLGMQDPLRKAVELFDREDVDILPVVDRGTLVGVVGREDLVRLLLTGDDVVD